MLKGDLMSAIRSTSVESPVVQRLRGEIVKFLAVTRCQANSDLYAGRRQARRHYRTWPLLVSSLADPRGEDLSVSLANASQSGLAFRSKRRYRRGGVLAIKLFWHDPGAFRVPAIVRHCTRDGTGFCIGVEFALDAPELVERVCEARMGWYEGP